MTSWSPSTAAAYIAANGLETAFYSRYPNAYGAQHAADWMAIWLDSSNVTPPGGPDNPADQIDYSGANAEEVAISQSPTYVMPFTPVNGSTPTVFPPVTSGNNSNGSPVILPPVNSHPVAGSSQGPLLLVAALVALWFLARED